MSQKQTPVVVVGAGVVGLTTALLLARSGRYAVEVVAKHMPGDSDIEYTSPFAGANFWPSLTQSFQLWERARGGGGHADEEVGNDRVSPKGTVAAEWDRVTFNELWRLATSVPEAGVHIQDSFIYNREKDKASVTGDWFNELLSTTPWFKDTLPDFRQLSPSELPTGFDSGTTFKSVQLNPEIYLPYLLSQCLRHSVHFRRAVLTHIADAATLHPLSPNPIIVNCTGLSSAHLGGVNDPHLTPARGQIVLVRNVAPAMYVTSGTDDGDDEPAYIMTRAAGGGTILGGSYQKGNWSKEIDMALAKRIMKRAVELCPQLVKQGQGVEGLDVIRHAVGLRPLRIGGVRIEREKMREGEGGKVVEVVHNYGAAGFGYQASYGMAEQAVRLVDEAAAEASGGPKL